MGNAESNVSARTNDRRSSDEIKHDLDTTRHEMDETIDALVQRLDPGALVSRAWQNFTRSGSGARTKSKETGAAAAEIGSAVVAKFKNNPIPAALIGAGAAWLLMSSDEPEDEHSYSGYRTDVSDERVRADIGRGDGGRGIGSTSGNMTESAKSRAATAGAGIAGAARSGAASVSSGAKSAMSGATSTGRRVAGSLRGGSRGASRSARRGAAATQESVQVAMQDYPLAFGAAMLGLGMVCGLIVPETQREHEMLGPQSDRLKDKSKEAISEAVERGKAIAETTVSAAQEKLEEEGLDPAHLTEKTKSVAAHAKQAAKGKMREEGATPEDLKRRAEQSTGGAKEGTETRSGHVSPTSTKNRQL
jgi:hypothetical protein